MTLENAVVYCGSRLFKAGMAYTALSRVRKLDDLILSKFKFETLQMENPLVEEEYNRLDGLALPWTSNDWATTIIPIQPTSPPEDNKIQLAENEEPK